MTAIPPGWYADPSSASTLRYWDGTAWTPYRHPTVPPLHAPQPSAPAGTSWNTVWIWLVVAMLALPSLWPLLSPGDGGMDDILPPAAGGPAQLQVLGELLQLASQLLGYVTYGLAVFFAYRDHRELRERGVPGPFHWAWAFLTPVYPIGRSVVVVRRIGRGWAPLWATVAVLALSLLVVGLVLMALLTAMADLFIMS